MLTVFVRYIILLYTLGLICTTGSAQPTDFNDLTELQIAVEEGNVQKVNQLITDGVDINQLNRWGVSAIETAIEADQTELVKLLLAKGATSKSGLERAVANNNAELVRILIKNDFAFGNSLVYATENNNLSMVHLLVKSGSPVRVVEKRKKGLFRKYYVTPIEKAVEHNNKAMVDYLLDNGAELTEAIDESFDQQRNELLKHLIDSHPDYPQFLLPAVDNNNRSIIDYLLAKGAKTDIRDQNGNTLLHLSCKKGNTSLVRFFTEDHNLDVNAQNSAGETPLMKAVAEGDLGMVNYLISKNAEVDAIDNRGETALFMIAGDRMDILTVLLNNGADISHTTHNHTTLLINAAKKGNEQVIEFLLSKGADISTVNDEGFSAFQYIIAPHGRNNALVDLFLERGADINTTDAKSGKSIMYHAIDRGNIEQISALLDRGADINAVDIHGNRPRVRDRVLIMFLIEHGADINTLDGRHDSYLCVAVNENDLELAHFLVDRGIDVNQNCYFSESPIIKAIEDDNVELVKFLADNNADINAIGYFDRNVMEYAERKGNAEIIEFLKSRGAMTSEERKELYRQSMEVERKLKAALSSKNQEELMRLLRDVDGMIIQNRLINRMAEFAAEKGNPAIIERLISNLAFDIDSPINFFEQTVLMVATDHDKTSLVSYLIDKGCYLEAMDSNGKKASDYARSRTMKKIYRGR